jgi:formate-dependent nitrite reductase membrane component NrfD
LALTPTAAQFYETYIFADLVTEQRIPTLNGNGHNSETGFLGKNLVSSTQYAKSGAAIRAPGAQGVGYGGGPILIGEGRMAEHMVQTAYNAQHKIPWHWPVPAYLVTKGIGSGIFMLLALLFGLNIVPFSRPVALLGDFLSLLFMGLTTLLLVLDLDRPERFFTILTRPQWKSWLARGAFVLVGFSAVAGLWLVVEGGAALNLIGNPVSDMVRPLLLVIGCVLAVLAAIYTGFLFGQAEGRDLWQSGLLPVHLLLQALMVGSGALLAAGAVVSAPPALLAALAWTFGASLVADLFVTLLGEFGMPHASEVAARAAHQIRQGKYRLHFWGGYIALGHGLALALLLIGTLSGQPQGGQPQGGQPQGLPLLVAILAALAAIAGLYLYEYAFVMAPQEIPNS